MEEPTSKLFAKYLKGECTDTDMDLLLSHFKLTSKELLTKKLISGALMDVDPAGIQVPELEDRLQTVHRKLRVYIQADRQGRKGYRLGWKVAAIAASLVLVLGTALYFYVDRPDSRAYDQNNFVKNDIAPGGNRAVLKLSDGSEISLAGNHHGKVTEQSGVLINRTADGQIVYTGNLEKKGAKARAVPSFNILSTPRGGTYQVRLSDGTLVFLNSASSIKYPADFAELPERRVELIGEAYFEVRHNAKQPFRVLSAGQVVQDIGTVFNIKAYQEEPSVKTTLIEGAASVNGQVLIPGQQARLAKGKIEISAADVEEAIAWKQGYFLFRGEKIESVMRKLTNWYNVEVVYQGISPSSGFRGKISRARNISAVLEILQLTGSVHFKVEGRRVTVMN